MGQVIRWVLVLCLMGFRTLFSPGVVFGQGPSDKPVVVGGVRSGADLKSSSFTRLRSSLFGIASDDGVVMLTYLKQTFHNKENQTVDDIRRDVIAAGTRRIRPCLMTTATTILALIPVLTATGTGSDIMVPMAIPSFGGMTIEVLTMLVVPVIYSWLKEARSRKI